MYAYSTQHSNNLLEREVFKDEPNLLLQLHLLQI